MSLRITHRLVEAASLSPSMRPAHELPEYEPTAEDLAAVDSAGTDEQLDDHHGRVLTLCAVEQRHRDLLNPSEVLDEAPPEADLPLTWRCAA